MATSKGYADMSKTDDNFPKENITNALMGFSWKLYKTSTQISGKDNLFISPFSIAVALAMTYVGARNESAQELKQTMNLEEIEDQKLHSTFSTLLRSLISGSDETTSFKLKTANKIYLEETYQVETAFMEILTTQYRSEVTQVDFIKNAENARKSINNWVEKVTTNKIRGLIRAGAIDSLTRLVLVNAIYFKANWAKKFPKSLTKEGNFFCNPNSPTKLMFMKSQVDFPYFESKDLNCSVLQLPYAGERLSMIIILPNGVDSLSDLEQRLDAKVLRSLIDSLITQKLWVTIPKFKLNLELPLKRVLMSLGIQKLFSALEADLTGISAKNNLYVSDAFHKAFVRVNEEGTEAAAVTALHVEQSLYHYEVFTADHPFLFFIYDSQSHLILFVGRLTEPSNCQ